MQDFWRTDTINHPVRASCISATGWKKKKVFFIITREVDMQFPVCHMSYFSMPYNKLESINKNDTLPFRASCQFQRKLKRTRTSVTLQVLPWRCAVALQMVFLCGLYQSRLPGSCWRTAVWLLCGQPSPRRPSASGVCAAVLRWAAPRHRSLCSCLSRLFFLEHVFIFFLSLCTYSWKWTTELIHGQCCWDVVQLQITDWSFKKVV